MSEEVFQIPGPGNFQFSSVRVDELGSTEYTLATIVVDCTGSVHHLSNEILNCLRNVVKSLKPDVNPRGDFILLRVIAFNRKVWEIHGFKPVIDIDPEVEYSNFNPSGTTALYDATFSGLGATFEEAKRLSDQDFDVNGAIFIITDGMDNDSQFNSPMTILNKIEECLRSEDIIESMISILIGIYHENDPDKDQIMKGLEEFTKDAKLTDYINAGEATPKKIAKIAGYISKSISSQSQSINSGQPSQVLQF